MVVVPIGRPVRVVAVTDGPDVVSTTPDAPRITIIAVPRATSLMLQKAAVPHVAEGRLLEEGAS